eukprot:COSAG06_NODE_3838_length_4850_cov_2.920017_7_plen_202_part_00
MICLRHTGRQASRSQLLPCYPRTTPDKHTIRWRDRWGEARRPGSSTSPACAEQRHHRLRTAKSGARFSCPHLGTLCSSHARLVRWRKAVATRFAADAGNAAVVRTRRAQHPGAGRRFFALPTACCSREIGQTSVRTSKIGAVGLWQPRGDTVKQSNSSRAALSQQSGVGQVRSTSGRKLSYPRDHVKQPRQIERSWSPPSS